MMNTTISIFKNAKTASNPYNRSIGYFLDRIKNGSPATNLVLEYRKTMDSEVKKKLPGACISGKFSHRAKDKLIEYSQFACLDFDKFGSLTDAEAIKANISNDPCCFSAFISPSGLGVKAIFRTAPDSSKYESYYRAMCKKYSDVHLDSKTKDISRLCFESYDPDIYINENAKEWSEVEEEELSNIGYVQNTITVPLRSEQRIIEKLQVWFDKKYSMSSGNRNNSLFVFASALNTFGINQMSAESYLIRYAEKGFNSDEINNIIRSAYKNVSDFNTRVFEDAETRIKIEKGINCGKKAAEIKAELTAQNNPVVQDDNVFNNAVSKIKNDEESTTFWKFSDAGAISLVPHKYEKYLRDNSFFKYYPGEKSEAFIFVYKDSNLIEETSNDRIKDFVLTDLKNRDDIGYAPYDFMALNTKFFKSDFLSLLSPVDINLKKDTATTCYLYYQNCVVEVTADSCKTIEYIDMDSYVWKSNVISRYYRPFDHHGNEFRSFIWYISGQDKHSYNCFKSAIGYLLHTYKTNADNKAIILNDEMISDNPNGRSGKGLFFNGIKQLKKLVSINGKNFDSQGQFAFQTVSTDTQVLVFDDVRRNFPFEDLFSIITEGLTIEYKGQGAVKLPVEKSPKIVITTNYTIKGEGGSFDARKHELELSSYFNKDHTPKKQFGHLLFDDWSEDEWSRFDNFMIQCVQFYMKNGLITQHHKNLEVRKLMNEISPEFYQWCEEGNLTTDYRWGNSELFSKFTDENPDFKKTSQRTIKKWLKMYCEFKGLIYSDGVFNNQRYFYIYKNGSEKTQSQFDSDEQMSEDANLPF